MAKKRFQVSMPVTDEELDLINKAQIGLGVRDEKPRTRKDTFLILCSEFLNNNFPDKDDSSEEKSA